MCSTQDTRVEISRVQMQDAQDSPVIRPPTYSQQLDHSPEIVLSTLETARGQAIINIKKRAYRSSYSAMVNDFEELKVCLQLN